MTVYTCSPDLASILTCIYEAWNSRLGYRNVRLMTEPVGNLELFCDYCHVEPDTEKAASVTRSIQKKIGAAARQDLVLQAVCLSGLRCLPSENRRQSFRPGNGRSVPEAL